MRDLDGKAGPAHHATPPRGGTLRTTLRLSLGLIGAALIVFGGIFLWTGFRLRAECREAEAAQLLDLRIDVGAAGEHRAALTQIAGFTCRQYIRLEPELRDGEDAATLLQGLVLTIAVEDHRAAGDGAEWLAGAFPSPLTAVDDAGVTLVNDRPMPVGDYTVVVDVVSPAPALAGRPVRIVSGYILCGLEWLGPKVAIGGGATALLLGAIIGAALWGTHRKDGVKPA